MKKSLVNIVSNLMTGLIVTGAILVGKAAASDNNAANIVAEPMPQIETTNEDFLIFDEKVYPEVHCLALNIYYETRGSNLADHYAVADVVLNRTNDNRWPNTICGVVKQGYKHTGGQMKRNQCQFSWYCDGKADVPQDEDSWIRAQTVAWKMVYYGNMRGITEGANHYHASYVDPSWAADMQIVGRIGAHIYYRWN